MNSITTQLEWKRITRDPQTWPDFDRTIIIMWRDKYFGNKHAGAVTMRERPSLSWVGLSIHGVVGVMGMIWAYVPAEEVEGALE